MFFRKEKKFIVQNMRETFVLNTDIYIVYLQKSYDYWVACEWRQEDLILGSPRSSVGISADLFVLHRLRQLPIAIYHF